MPDLSIPKGVSRPSSLDARRAWRAAQQPAYVPHPEPEVRARQAQPDEIPTGAKRIAKTAGAHGWAVRVWYSRGTTLTARGLPGKVVETVLVGMIRPADRSRAVASWLDGAFELAYIGLRGGLAVRVGARALKAAVETPVEYDDKEAA